MEFRINTAAKLNFGLQVTSRQLDGYHLLETVMVPISLFDQLTFAIDRERESSIEFRCIGGEGGCNSSNLVVRAAKLFLERTPLRARISIVLSKSIPVGAGLGGGSSDAASVLVVLNGLLDKPVSQDQLCRWGLELGADVPFFVVGVPALVRGIGEHLLPVSIDWKAPILVAYPGFGLSTRLVYETYDRTLTLGTPQSKRTSFSDSFWPSRNFFENDLESAAFSIRPELCSLREEFIQLGAETCVMSGSGSALFGFWKRRSQLRVAAQALQARGVWARIVEVLSRSRQYLSTQEFV